MRVLSFLISTKFWKKQYSTVIQITVMIYRSISIPFFWSLLQNCSQVTLVAYPTLGNNNGNKGLMTIKMLHWNENKISFKLRGVVSVDLTRNSVHLHVCRNCVFLSWVKLSLLCTSAQSQCDASPPLWHAVALLASSKHGGRKAELVSIYIHKQTQKRQERRKMTFLVNSEWTVQAKMVYSD